MASGVDIVLLSLASFLGNVGVALTGFGMAIIFLFVWQIAVLAGFDSTFKYAVFIQALALFSAQPLMLYKAEIREYASRRMLRYFIPITIIATPLGQITGDRVSTDIVEAVGGVLVTFVAVFEIYQKRDFFASLLCRKFNNHVEKKPDAQINMETDRSEHGSEGDHVEKNPDAQITTDTDGSEHGSEGDHVEKNPDAQMIMETNVSVHRSESDNSICVDQFATIGENVKVAVETNRPQHESEASICIDDFASLIELDATVSENANVAVETNIPKNESEVSISIDEFSSHFDLDATLGRGSFSIVKEGTQKETGRSYAIKIVSKTKLFGGEEAKLKEEISIMQELKHPNIIRLYDVFTEPDYFLVTEKMAGGDLLSRINGMSFLGELQGRRVCKSILEAVRYMHSKKIAHRDLKPENLLLDSDSDDAVVKLADFGFAKREKLPNSFTTMCGTANYVAPEILRTVPYGIAADLWSVGIIAYILLVGYQPFRGEDVDTLQNQIRNGVFEFDEEIWSNITNDAKSFISSVLKVDPAERLSANEALAHKWFTLEDLGNTFSQNETPVFFMIGSQRSGSNWLRTMLDEREDLVGPHPPHMLRDFMPIIDKFGDLSVDDNLKVLADHVCTFVERNQVPWTDKHGENIKFNRSLINATAAESCERLRTNRVAGREAHVLESALYLLSIFDAIMSSFTQANGKRIWMCKSMGISQFHDILLEFYGEKRLRYIYLVRDPRDVAMSFMKTPVGDCHYHAIVTKWTALQGHALRIVEECPDLVHKVHYESILQDKENVVKEIYGFIGERQFGGIKRQASVLFMDPTEDLINSARMGREARKSMNLSYQFKNLGRGPSFTNRQLKKWLNPETGLKVDDIQLIESVAHQMMEKLGYATHLVGVSATPTNFTEDAITHFNELNKDGIQKMNDDLQKENPGDFDRREYQAEVLSFSPTYLEACSSWEQTWSDTPCDSSCSPYLSDFDLELRLSIEPEGIIPLPEGGHVRWATASQRGYYPFEPDKPNQDASKSQGGIVNGGDLHWFSVFDGHGPDGHKCAKYATENIPTLFASEVSRGGSVKSALEKSHLTTHEHILTESSIDSRQSGTTAVSLLLENKKCFVSNVGDSACILGSQTTADGVITAKHLCTEHSPLRADERERIERAGGVIMTVDQRDGIAPMHDNWKKRDCPPRIWAPTMDDSNKFPGCGFTRSIGDSVAHSLGVVAKPEIFEYELEKKDRVLIIASDGITEFMDAATCVEIACRFQDPSEAAQVLIEESTKCWIEQGDYMDDMTAIVLFLDSPVDPVETLKAIREDVDLDLEVDLEVGSNPVVVLEVGTSPVSVLEVDTNPVVVEDLAEKEEVVLGLSAQFWTLFAGAISGFLGGLCGIRGPPIILYFLHPPFPVSFTKNTQRATGACITFTNVLMRVAYYLVDTLLFDGEDYFEGNDWGLYVAIVISSILGVLVGSQLFEHMKDSKATIRGILAMLLLLCGMSLLLSSFAGI